MKQWDSKPIITLFLTLAAYFLLSATSVLAADLSVTCNGVSCSSTPANGHIFNEDNILPLDSFSRSLKAINTSPDALNFAIEVVDPYTSNTLPSLSDVISIVITESESSNIVYGPKTIAQWKVDGYTVLGNIPAGEERNYLFNATFANVGNDYQGRELVFDLNLGFEALPGNPSPTPTPTSTSNNEGVSAGQGSAANGNGGATAGNNAGASANVFLSGATPTSIPILGVQEDQQAAITETAPQVAGEATCQAEYYYWWLPLVLQAMLTLGYLLAIGKKRHRRYYWIIPVVLGIISQIIHWLLGCNCATDRFCPWYWLFNLVIVITLVTAYLINRRKKHGKKTETRKKLE